MTRTGSLLFLIAVLLLPGAAIAQGGNAVAVKCRAVPQADPAYAACEEAAKTECKAKADPSVLVSFWKASAQAGGRAASADLENRARGICLARGASGGSYSISGKAGPMTVRGTVCDLTKRFTAQGVGGSMKVDYVYTPDSATSGKMSYTGIGTGAAAGVRMAGQGTYTVKLDAKGGTLTYDSGGRVLNPGGGAARNINTLKLTPAGPC
jgi:hypothetical protein